MNQAQLANCKCVLTGFVGNHTLKLPPGAQIGIVDVLREDYGIRPAGILGHSAGGLDAFLANSQKPSS